jgi:hypothetical protein
VGSTGMVVERDETNENNVFVTGDNSNKQALLFFI